MVLFVLLVACSTSNTNHLKIAVLQELYFMEKKYSKKECDYFIYNKDIVNELKDKFPEITLDILEECQELRIERSKNYNR